MDLLGNPQNSYKVIHVAGTCGKSSTCYYLAALLAKTGKKIGLTVSPHVDQVNERVQINLNPLPEQEFCKELSEFLIKVDETGVPLSYFETLVAFAYWEFAKQQVDYAVVEVGLGGLLDGTNIITNPTKVSVITDIGFDHMKVLGNRIEQIAFQKAGIIIRNSTVFTYRQSDEVMEVIGAVASSKQAELFEITPKDLHDRLPSLPIFQRRNWYLAEKVVEYVIERDNLGKLDDSTITATTKTYIPGRMEVVEYKGKTLILDGSHNNQKIGSLVDSVKEKYPNEKVALLTGLLEEKDNEIHDAIKQLSRLSNKIITTTFKSKQDVPRDAMSAEKMKTILQDFGVSDVTAITDPVEAFERLVNLKENVLVVTGSFYLLNSVRPIVFSQ
jgi:dihydrofolate synthase/folylpolyglutamate synthase